jgi:hypothetical protein
MKQPPYSLRSLPDEAPTLRYPEGEVSSFGTAVRN